MQNYKHSNLLLFLKNKIILKNNQKYQDINNDYFREHNYIFTQLKFSSYRINLNNSNNKLKLGFC